jgi:hypothetical protein
VCDSREPLGCLLFKAEEHGDLMKLLFSPKSGTEKIYGASVDLPDMGRSIEIDTDGKELLKVAAMMKIRIVEAISKTIPVYCVTFEDVESLID